MLGSRSRVLVEPGLGSGSEVRICVCVWGPSLESRAKSRIESGSKSGLGRGSGSGFELQGQVWGGVESGQVGLGRGVTPRNGG